MKKTTDGHRAHLYERIQATNYDEKFASRDLYAVDDLHGVFRRVKVPGKDEPVPEGMLRVFFQGKIVCVVRDLESTNELTEGGFIGIFSHEEIDLELSRIDSDNHSQGTDDFANSLDAGQATDSVDVADPPDAPDSSDPAPDPVEI